MAAVTEQQGNVGGIDARWLEAPAEGGHAPVLYVHGVPTAGWEWRPFLERTGGYAPDLPGFGKSGKLADFDYSIPGYAAWLRELVDRLELERFSLVTFDWGVVGLALAQAIPERIERLVVASGVPLLPGYRWHSLARRWRMPLIGEMAMGFTFKPVARATLGKANREPLPKKFFDALWEDFDHGTQRAILKLYRSAPSEVLAAAGRRLGEIGAPALVVHGGADPYIPERFAHAYAEALGHGAVLKVVPGAGHWPWLDEPSVVDEIAGFVTQPPRSGD